MLAKEITLNGPTTQPITQVVVTGEFSIPVPPTILAGAGRTVMQELRRRFEEIAPDARITIHLADSTGWTFVLKRYDGASARFDLSHEMFGCVFNEWPDLPSAFDASTAFQVSAIETLETEGIAQLVTHVGHTWRVPNGHTNMNVLTSHLIPCWGASPFAVLDPTGGKLKRFDIRTSLPIDSEHHEAYVSLELPANDERRTIWSTLIVQTTEAVGGLSARRTVEEFTDTALRAYNGPYAHFFNKALGPLALTYAGAIQ